MPVTRAQLLDRLKALGIDSVTVDHPALHTVEESRALRGQLPGAHTKNLFLKCKKDRLFLVVALEDATLDLKGLHRLIGASGRLSFGNAGLLLATLGVTPGSVTPFGLINDTAHQVTLILDAELMRNDELNFHPLENTATTRLARDGFLRFVAECGHEPRILPVSEEARARQGA